MHMKTVLPLDVGAKIVDAALAAGRAENMHPLTIVVLDVGGRVVAVKSEDGSGTLRFGIALGKASGALGMGISSRLIRDRLSDRIAFQSALASAADGKFIPVPGGVLIEDADGCTIGAVGISGDTSEKDEYCAIKGIHAAGFASEPAQIDPDWTRSYLSDKDRPKD